MPGIPNSYKRETTVSWYKRAGILDIVKQLKSGFTDKIRVGIRGINEFNKPQNYTELKDVFIPKETGYEGHPNNLEVVPLEITEPIKNNSIYAFPFLIR